MAQNSTARTVKIGVLSDLSGPYADVGGMGSVVAARLAIEDSGLPKKGWTIEVVAADHQNKADIAANTALKWYDTEGVDAITDLVNSAAALAVSQISRDKNKVVLASGPATSDLTGKACSPNTVHWTSDTWAFANGTGKALVKTGGDTWFFLTADYTFGHSLERDTEKVVLESGGKVLGKVRAPIGTSDFASFLLQAQASKAKIVALANSGADTINAIKQAAEFGLVAGGQRMAGMLLYIVDIHSLGLRAAQGTVLTSPFYWDMNDDTRSFAARFASQMRGAKPTMIQAGTYSAVLHYLKAVEALGDSKDGTRVVGTMKDMPTDDPLFGKGRIRADGRKIHPMYLFQVKSPEESKGDWDYYKLLATIPAEEAFRPLDEGGCPLVGK
ncbi:ABC transporter substrate-binding protein [Xanthobacter autotrophicus DSM 431]